MISSRFSRRTAAFTLVELMVATVVLIIILLMLVAMVNQTSQIWRGSTAKAEQFRSARNAFDSITRHLSQATLNTYYDYQLDATTQQPLKYVRNSDLRFLVGSSQELVPTPASGDNPPKPGPGHAVFFQAPLGFVSSDTETMDPTVTSQSVSLYAQNDNLLNTWGYFIEYGSDASYRPTFLNVKNSSFKAPPERYRYRLMEFMVPSDQINIYQYTASKTNGTYNLHDWFDFFLKYPAGQSTSTTGSQSDQVRPAHLLAENIIMMVIQPQLTRADQAKVQAVGASLAPGYSYDTAQTAAPMDARVDPRNQLPPVVQVTMVAIDEGSASRVDARNSNKSNEPDAIKQVVTGRFEASQVAGGNPQLGTTAVNYTSDLDALQKDLVKARITYRTFNTSISLRGAKWSRD